ncbi:MULTISPECIES: hypothetical protein [unclassified Sphingomonas]|uniref:hypothetical protein n=1 Tax=unclassified Sphingomonas TaxID=196159 RepID=UPI0006FF1E70|nr:MULTISPECIES: hypothetical protein [unclassified Sphingomonas]KQM26488.1 hypothetical protein ASE58_12270 [Sphingomonas sp. Leaf9]KQM42897.1 hypothetical protein ASE57_12275 [Sphingomonas sp. Leaf11]
MTDVTKLDWARWYRKQSGWPLRANDRLFLAEAVLRIAPLLIFPWDDIIPLGTMANEQPLLPGTLDAFDWDGNPRPEVHGAWAPALLNYMSAAEFTSQRMERQDPDAWLAAHKYDPVSGGMVFDPAKAYTSGTGVSFEHWDTASFQAAEINELRRVGMICMPLLARAIADMAVAGDIRTIARPINGGAEVALTAEQWFVDDASYRLASCGLDLENPFDVDATPTHLIFIDLKGFDEHVALYARRHMISLIEEGITPDEFGIKSLSKKALYPTLVAKAYPLMKAHVQAHPQQYHRSVLRKIVESELGSVSDGVFEAARGLLKVDYPHITDGGAPVGTARRRVVNITPKLGVIKGGKS